ncbi:LAGLIDADG family homing endonuclease [Glycomyces sp. NPDC048151]|uniref:LAGLIDADG family homing endonuclease n=1 Tax=Glycomyces sp. NPDC048151 TaxID=3364002 RepID=UPI003713DAB5
MFDITRPEVAYLIGLLQTDGTHGGSLDVKGKVTLELAARDEAVLPRLAAVIPCYTSIRHRTRDTNFSKAYESVTLSFYDQDTRKALAALGVPPGRKSRSIAPPRQPFSRADYVRGVLDGDGSVGFTAKGLPFVSLVTASPALAEFFCEVLQEVCGVARTARQNQRDGVANIIVVNTAAAKLATWAWYSPDALSIDRKLRAATQVAAWVPDPANAARYDIVRKAWTPEEDQPIEEHSIAEAAALLGRTEKSVSARRSRLRGSAARAAWLRSIQEKTIQ